jgi:hypothetical protein
MNILNPLLRAELIIKKGSEKTGTAFAEAVIESGQ